MSEQINQFDPRLSRINSCLYRLSAKALIIHEQKVFLIKEWDDEWWSFPGGGVEYSETLHGALARELYEELATAENDLKIHNEILHFGIGAIVEKIPMANIFYRVDISKDKIQPTAEVVSSGWFGIEEIKKLKLVPTTSDTEELLSIVSQEITKE